MAMIPLGCPCTHVMLTSGVTISPSESRSHMPVTSPFSQISSRSNTVAESKRKVAVPVVPSLERVSATSGTANSAGSCWRKAIEGTTSVACGAVLRVRCLVVIKGVTE
eukprot:4896055-Pleurochrysis_carterae.AAC.3